MTTESEIIEEEETLEEEALDEHQVPPYEAKQLYQEFKQVGYTLSKHHGIFTSLFSLGKIIPTRTMPTAGVAFDTELNRVMFYINPDFFQNLSFSQKQFVLCHEMLHVIYQHVHLARQHFDPRILNIAADVVINESLVSEFGFMRQSVDPENIFIWHNKQFADPRYEKEYPDGVPKERSTEFYYNLIDDNLTEEEKDQLQNNLDDHSKWGMSKEEMDAARQAVQDAIDKLSPEEQKDLKDKLDKSYGNEAGTTSYTFKTKRVQPDYRWRKIIRVINGDRAKAKSKTWLKEDFRLTKEFLSKDVLLPAPGPKSQINRKPNIWLFMDISGSCIHLKDDFWAAKESIPKSMFNVRTFTFDTQVKEVTNKNFSGGGGTSFQCIENFLRTQENYPAYVWVITDGEAYKPELLHPKRWYWFLDDCYSTDAIPESSAKYGLRNLKKWVD